MRTALHFTISDVETLPDTLDDTRYEIIGGELYVSHQPSWDHQLTATDLSFALGLWNRRTNLGLTVQAPGVIFSEEDAVAPDVIWTSNERLSGGLDSAGHLRFAPELMIEILSAGSENIRRDREAKLKLYDAYGVEEYWVADWQLRIIDVYRRRNSGLSLVETLTDVDIITSPLLPGFSLPIAELWPVTR